VRNLPWLDAGALARILAGQPKLARLTVDNCPLDGVTLGELPALTELTLDRIFAPGSRALDLALARMPSLTTLDVRLCFGLTGATLPSGLTRMSIMDAPDFDPVKALERTPNLGSLVLHTRGMKAPLPALPCLEHLELFADALPDEAFLAGMPRLASLETTLPVEDRHLALLPDTMARLTLRNASRITEAALGRFTRLSKLDVGYCRTLTGRLLPPGLTSLRVSDSCVLNPSALPCGLECLTISLCHGITFLELGPALPRLAALRHLHLEGWSLGPDPDPDPQLFARMPHLREVRWQNGLVQAGEWRRGPATPAAAR